jgi:hypothetical protein
MQGKHITSINLRTIRQKYLIATPSCILIRHVTERCTMQAQNLTLLYHTFSDAQNTHF